MVSDLSPEALRLLASWLGSCETRKHECPLKRVSDLLEYYFIWATIEYLLQSITVPEFRVALQFPDSLLPYAPFVCEALQLCTTVKLQNQAEDAERLFFFFVLGDTSYGECCVDEVAAQHLSADLIVHYGNACLSPTRSTPIIYVFPVDLFESPELALSIVKNSLKSIACSEHVDRVVILYDIALFSCFGTDEIKFNDISFNINSGSSDALVELASPFRRAHEKIINPGRLLDRDDSAVKVGPLQCRSSTVPTSRTAFIWFSKDCESGLCPPAARNAALTLCTGPQEHCAGFYGVSLTTPPETMPGLVDSSRLLRKRFSLLSKAKDADRIGIVPGTLGVSGNVEVINRCKRVIKSAGKRSYVVLVGKLNPSKLANFPEIDVFVLVACPQHALLDSRDYLRPIITPLELEAALLSDGDLFGSPYSTDFRDLLEKPLALGEDAETAASAGPDSAVALRGDWTVSVTGEGGAAEYLKSRIWRGLSYETGGVDDETAVDELPVRAEEGQSGIACKYRDEVERSKSNVPTGFVPEDISNASALLHPRL